MGFSFKKNSDLSQYMIDSKNNTEEYNLFSVLNHYGDIDKGHCTAYQKNTVRQWWFKFGYHEVSVKSSAAYILFYTSKRPAPTNSAAQIKLGVQLTALYRCLKWSNAFTPQKHQQNGF